MEPTDEARSAKTTGSARRVAGTARRRAGGWRAARWARRAVQIVSFVLFVYLLFAGLQRLQPQPLANIFFRFDPLAALATMLAARTWLAPFALAFVTLGVTLVLGRVWCGWICPMGTLLGWLRFRSARRLAGRMPPALRRVKYVLFGAVVVLAALGNLTLLVLDPLALLTRTTTTSVIPGFVYLVDALERAGMTWGPTVGVVRWTEETLRGTVLPTVQPRYEQGVALFLVLLAIVLLNALADRFWCRYLCPLGALLGLVAKVQLLRPVISDGCGACGACAAACRLDAIEVGGRGASRAANGAGHVAARPARQLRVHHVPRLPGGVPARGRRLAGRGPARALGRVRPRPPRSGDRGGGRGGRGPALRDGRRAGRQAPGPDPSAGRAGRGPLSLPLPALQRVHEGLPDLRPAAHAR